jgi:hypothetical protein
MRSSTTAKRTASSPWPTCPDIGLLMNKKKTQGNLYSLISQTCSIGLYKIHDGESVPLYGTRAIPRALNRFRRQLRHEQDERRANVRYRDFRHDRKVIRESLPNLSSHALCQRERVRDRRLLALHAELPSVSIDVRCGPLWCFVS